VKVAALGARVDIALFSKHEIGWSGLVVMDEN